MFIVLDIKNSYMPYSTLKLYYKACFNVFDQDVNYYWELLVKTNNTKITSFIK